MKKKMHKSKGRWVVVAGTLAFLYLQSPLAEAEETIVDQDEASLMMTGEETVFELVEEMIEDVLDVAADDEEIAEVESDGDIIVEEVEIVVEEAAESIHVEEVPTTVSMQTLTTKNSAQIHTVKSGEYLYLIGQRYGVEVQQIKDWNQLTSNYIYSGDRLYVSQPDSHPSQPPIAIEPQYYVVKTGDTLWRIASQNAITVSQVKSWNQLKTDVIFAGDRFVVSNPWENPTEPEVPAEPAEPELPEVPEVPEPPQEPEKPEEPEQPTEPEAPKEETPQPPTYYTVKSGDYLWKIATQYGITVDQLKSWNNLTSNYIYSGDRLVVTNPVIVQPPKEKEPPTPTPPQPQAKYHTVKSGEYLWLIASQNNISVAQLKSWNNLTSNYIYSGDRLVVTNPVIVQPPKEKEPPTPTPPQPQAKYHTVKSGEYLWLIASQNNISVAQLKSWNNLTSNYIYSGDRLLVTDPKQTAPANPEEGLTGNHGAVQDVLNQYKNSSIYVFYESLVEGDLRTASLNGDRSVYGASVPKIVLIAYTLEQVEKGNLSWQTPLTYTPAIYNYAESYSWGGSGTIQYENYQNKSYTLQEVVRRTIDNSDNLGSNMLLHYVGYRDKADFNRFTQEVYGAPSYSRNMTARQINQVMRYIYDHPQQYAMEAMDQTDYDNTKLDTVAANVFQKIGAWWPYYNHSTGIVDGTRPYIITILTDYWSDSAIGNLAKQIFNAVKG
ncbi:LysM peptidoglycan-binding domain-containing protein [Fundicoccus culcitae]|uniref:LysM peptidoglycan-binding domain-containing protein n=1 Tax=Fundicoccus culcitae TaxID=2969821 RepID=A0ABY5P5A8_9LACT|nr:LysM peptidoglycan-binding domain-containing protein [Fundicoccus culcitae]UUX33598.1 LysM peptidoglycan-binding domain-containing protein [Fundicoccus culcitae]